MGNGNGLLDQPIIGEESIVVTGRWFLEQSRAGRITGVGILVASLIKTTIDEPKLWTFHRTPAVLKALGLEEPCRSESNEASEESPDSASMVAQAM